MAVRDAVDDQKVAGSFSGPICGPRRFLGGPRIVYNPALRCHLVGGGLAHGGARGSAAKRINADSAGTVGRGAAGDGSCRATDFLLARFAGEISP